MLGPCWHPELDEDDDVGGGGGEHAGDGAPLYGEVAQAGQGAQSLHLLEGILDREQE